MMKSFFLTLVFIFLLCSTVMAAGTVVVTTDRHADGIYSITWTITADAANGSVPATASPVFNGFLYSCETNPGSTAPTDNYDITLTDANGADVMGGALLNRDTANTEIAYPTNTPYVMGGVTLNVSNNSVNSATVVLTCVTLQ